MTSNTGRFVDPVRRFADTIFDAARDVYGDRETGLLVDAVDPETNEPVAHDSRDVRRDGLLSNFAAQQEYLRTLDALTELTDDRRYRDRAESMVTAAFAELGDGTGLLYWGGHAAYDVAVDERVGQEGKTYHELKADYPYYDLFWQVAPSATRRFIEAFWAGHVLDWDSLDFNRHASFGEHRTDPWPDSYAAEPIFFWGDGLTFVNTGSDLYYAAGVLADLTGENAPLQWAQRLAERYVDTRGETGVGGYQFSKHTSWCNGPEILGDRAQYQFDPYIHGEHTINEGTLFRPRPYAQERLLVLGDRLGSRGERFTQWAVEELRAWRESAYRPEENTFEPMLTDGYSLEGFVCRREGYFGPKGRVIGPIQADGSILMVYATACRVAGDESCYDMVADVLQGLGFGEIEDPHDPPSLAVPDDVTDIDTLYGLIECYRATAAGPYRRAAWEIGERLIADRYADGYFRQDGIAHVGDALPLALLTLASTADGPAGPERLPTRGERPGVPPGGI